MPKSRDYLDDARQAMGAPGQRFPQVASATALVSIAEAAERNNATLEDIRNSLESLDITLSGIVALLATPPE